MSETLRLYRYRTLLAGGRVRTRTEMLELLEISPATFKRDLTKLRDQMRMPIVFDRDARFSGSSPEFCLRCERRQELERIP